MNDQLINDSLSPYAYTEFSIPAGTTQNLTFSFHLYGDSTINGTYLYYESDPDVYENYSDDGRMRVFSTGYKTEAILTKGGKPQLLKEPVGYARFYIANMVKDSKGIVKGGKVRIYHKPAVVIEDLNKGITVPHYYLDHIRKKTAQVRENMMQVGADGETFIFITDTHWESNTKNSPELVRYLLDHLNIRLILNGGDFINQGTRADSAENMQASVSSFLFNNAVMLCAFGNHDSNWNDWNHQRDYPDRFFDRKCQYALMQKHMEGQVTYFSDGWNYYHDRPATKTRFIVLDTNEDGTFGAFQKLHEVLNATPEGYRIIMLAHWLHNGTNKSTACKMLEQTIDSYNKRQGEFASGKARIILMLGGHIHKDMAWRTQDGIPILLSDSDAAGRTSNTKYPAVKRTTTEQAFDVFTINYQTGEIRSVRIGRGEDRAIPLKR